jgi:hypothetical protein
MFTGFRWIILGVNGLVLWKGQRILRVQRAVNFRNELLKQKRGKKIHMNVCLQKFTGYSPHVRPTSFVQIFFYPWRHLKTSMFSTPLENEETLHQCISYVLQTIGNRVGTFESFDIP